MTVALRTWAPHGRTFRAVEHAELDGAFVGHNSHLSTQSINFTHNLTLGNAAYGRIAAHLCYLVHIHSDKQRFRSQIGRSGCCFTAGVTGTYHYYIVVEIHK